MILGCPLDFQSLYRIHMFMYTPLRRRHVCSVVEFWGFHAVVGCFNTSRNQDLQDQKDRHVTLFSKQFPIQFKNNKHLWSTNFITTQVMAPPKVYRFRGNLPNIALDSGFNCDLILSGLGSMVKINGLIYLVLNGVLLGVKQLTDPNLSSLLPSLNFWAPWLSAIALLSPS